MILTHGANSIKRGPKGFMYLTYFNDVDSLNRIDTPVVGNSTEYVPSVHDASIHTLDTQSIKTFNYSGLFETSSQAFSFGHLMDVTDDVVSLEMLYLQKEGYGDAGFISDNNDASNSNDGLGIGYTNNGDILWCNRDYSHTLHNGCSYEGVGQRKRFSLPITLKGSLHHFAFVYSFVNNTISVYVDGVRYATLTKSGALSKNIWSIISSTENIVITQLCVRKGDCSIEGGASYPVPITPYYEIPLETVEIGGRDYKTVKIGNQLWMAENLDWKFSGCVIGASGSSFSEPRGNYYNNDESTYGENGYKYGLLYNWVAATQIDSLLTDGWRVPTNSDFTTLKSYLGNDASKIKSTSVWSPVGTDDFGFNAVPSGDYSHNRQEFSHIFDGCDFWSSSSYSSDRAYDMFLRHNNTSVNQSDDYKADLYSIRLVKDAT